MIHISKIFIINIINNIRMILEDKQGAITNYFAFKKNINSFNNFFLFLKKDFHDKNFFVQK